VVPNRRYGDESGMESVLVLSLETIWKTTSRWRIETDDESFVDGFLELVNRRLEMEEKYEYMVLSCMRTHF
jgi:hypothetical protein